MNADLEFLRHLHALGVPIWTAPPGAVDEFVWPTGWQRFNCSGNTARIKAHRPGHAFCGVMGGRVAAVDVDIRNGGDPAQVKQLLDALSVIIYADVRTPGGGRHFYIAGHPDLPTVHASKGRVGLIGYPGVEVISYGANLFLPGTQRPKYDGGGYHVLLDNLEALADGGDPDAGQTFAGWAADNRAHAAATFTPSPPWDKAPPDKRQSAFLTTVLSHQCAELAAMGPGSGRNVRLYLAALKCGNYVAGAGMDEAEVIDRLTAAADACGLTPEDGPKSVLGTIWSGLRNGRTRPRAVPEPKALSSLEQVPAGVDPTTGETLDTTQEPTGSPVDDLDAVRRRYPRLDLAALVSTERPPREWVITGLIPAGASVALIASAGTGKSLLLLSAMIGVARGDQTFAGLPIPRGRRVVLLDMENTRDDLADRLLALGVSAADVDELENLVIIHLPPLAPLDTEVGGAELAALLDAYGIKAGDVVVLDSLQRVIKGPENDSDTLRAFYRCTGMELKKRGLSVVRTDNTGKDAGKGARGTSGKRDDVDVELILTRDADNPDRLRIKPGKSRLPEISSVLINREVDEDGHLRFTTAGDPFRAIVADAHRLPEGPTCPWCGGEAA